VNVALRKRMLVGIVESLQSHCIHTQFHWSSGPVVHPFTSRHKGPGFNPQEGTLWNRDSPVNDVSLHWWPWHNWSLWPHLRRLRPDSSLGRHADNVIIPLDLTQLFCPGFMLNAGPPSSFTTNIVGCWGGALWRACNLTAFITVPLVQWSTRLLPVMRDPGSIPRGYLCETRIRLLALSHYSMMKMLH
jgi:hypothetical protein